MLPKELQWPNFICQTREAELTGNDWKQEAAGGMDTARVVLPNTMRSLPMLGALAHSHGPHVGNASPLHKLGRTAEDYA